MARAAGEDRPERLQGRRRERGARREPDDREQHEVQQQDRPEAPEEIRAAIGTADGVQVVELPGADHAYRIAKSSAFTPADLRTTLVAEVSRFIGAVAGISTS